MSFVRLEDNLYLSVENIALIEPREPPEGQPAPAGGLSSYIYLTTSINIIFRIDLNASNVISTDSFILKLLSTTGMVMDIRKLVFKLERFPRNQR